MDLRGKHIAIEGVIGVGKTSLARLLSERTGARLLLEAPDANPFLENFYKDQRRFSFPAQMFFLVSRYHELKDLRQPDLFHNGVVSDYLFQKDRIFANLNLSDQELALYEQVAALLEREIPAPDLVVYLQASPEIIWSRIQQRGRAYERAMDPKYTATLAPGDAKVTIRANKVVGKTKMYDTADSPTVDKVVELIDAQFNDASTLKLTVTPGQQKKDWEVKKRK